MSVQFAGKLTLAEAPGATGDGRAEWRVTSKLTALDPWGNQIVVGRGTRTDLGSVPEIAWSWGFPPDGIGVRAYVTHDLLYFTRGKCDEGHSAMSRKRSYRRHEADEILRQGLIACGVPKWRARCIWLAVRLGGHSGWGH